MMKSHRFEELGKEKASLFRIEYTVINYEKIYREVIYYNVIQNYIKIFPPNNLNKIPWMFLNERNFKSLTMRLTPHS